jgi:hypothetical protein
MGHKPYRSLWTDPCAPISSKCEGSSTEAHDAWGGTDWLVIAGSPLVMDPAKWTALLSVGEGMKLPGKIGPCPSCSEDGRAGSRGGCH